MSEKYKNQEKYKEIIKHINFFVSCTNEFDMSKIIIFKKKI